MDSDEIEDALPTGKVCKKIIRAVPGAGVG